MDFFATWCPPCKMIAPICHETSEKTGVGLIKVDVDQAKNLSQ